MQPTSIDAPPTRFNRAYVPGYITDRPTHFIWSSRTHRQCSAPATAGWKSLVCTFQSPHWQCSFLSTPGLFSGPRHVCSVARITTLGALCPACIPWPLPTAVSPVRTTTGTLSLHAPFHWVAATINTLRNSGDLFPPAGWGTIGCPPPLSVCQTSLAREPSFLISLRCCWLSADCGDESADMNRPQ